MNDSHIMNQMMSNKNVIDRSFRNPQAFTTTNIELFHQSYSKNCTTSHLLTGQKFI